MSAIWFHRNAVTGDSFSQNRHLIKGWKVFKARQEVLTRHQNLREENPAQAILTMLKTKNLADLCANNKSEVRHGLYRCCQPQ
jgi:hypothetical protein